MANSLPDSGTLSMTTPPTTTSGADRAATTSATSSPTPSAPAAATTPATAAYTLFFATSLSTHTVCARARAPPRSAADPSSIGKDVRAPRSPRCRHGCRGLDNAVVLVAVATVAVPVPVAPARLGRLRLPHHQGLRADPA